MSTSTATTMSPPIASSGSTGHGSTGWARPAAFRRYPRGSFIAVLDDAAASGRVVEALVAAGVDRLELSTMSGEDGRRRLDKDGRHHGLLARFQRGLVSALATDSENVVSLLDDALLRGGRLVVVPIKPAGIAAGLDVESLLVEQGARGIVRFNRWTIETHVVRRRR